MESTALFIHGLDSSSHGRKGRYFKDHFPNMIVPNFHGDLSNRLCELKKICKSLNNVILIGSSFGGLMATCYAQDYPKKVNKLILLAPALNFAEYAIPKVQVITPTTIIIGENDNVTPPGKVIPLAKATFANLEIKTYDDDHRLSEIFENLDWKEFLGEHVDWLAEKIMSKVSKTMK